MGSWAEKTCGKAAAGATEWARWWLADPERRWLVNWAVPHLRADKPGGTTGEQDRWRNPETQGSSSGK